MLKVWEENTNTPIKQQGSSISVEFASEPGRDARRLGLH